MSHSVVIRCVTPDAKSTAYPIKRTIGEVLEIEAEIFAHGSCEILAQAHLRGRDRSEGQWERLEQIGDDRWRGAFRLSSIGEHVVQLWASVDSFRTWLKDLKARSENDPRLDLILADGLQLVSKYALEADGNHRRVLEHWAGELATGSVERRRRAAFSEELAAAMDHVSLKRSRCTVSAEITVIVDRAKARFGSWYELFPRSASSDASRHGTFQDVVRALPRLQALGFDVLYLPPIHPIGRTARKGPNDALIASAEDPGVPWAVGSDEGGHTAVHPALGTLDDFETLVSEAQARGIELALDLAFQASPDHPWVRQHPEWFRHRSDGTIAHATNPPHDYEDVFPLDLEGAHMSPLWEALREVALFWVKRGVRIFRVDSPHLKPFAFWKWFIREVKKVEPGVLFLAEGLTRPTQKFELARLGFCLGYTYFPWKAFSKGELVSYIRKLDGPDVRDFFRPCHWANTHDTLPTHLHGKPAAAFRIQFVLAATLGASYGIYGPPFELCVASPRTPGSEEYADSEKYEQRIWDVQQSELDALIASVNAIRRDHRALQWNRITFHDIDNDRLVAFSKRDPEDQSLVLVVVNLDWKNPHSGVIATLALGADLSGEATELLSGRKERLRVPSHSFSLDPAVGPALIYSLRHA